MSDVSSHSTVLIDRSGLLQRLQEHVRRPGAQEVRVGAANRLLQLFERWILLGRRLRHVERVPRTRTPSSYSHKDRISVGQS